MPSEGKEIEKRKKKGGKLKGEKNQKKKVTVKALWAASAGRLWPKERKSVTTACYTCDVTTVSENKRSEIGGEEFTRWVPLVRERKKSQQKKRRKLFLVVSRCEFVFILRGKQRKKKKKEEEVESGYIRLG